MRVTVELKKREESPNPPYDHNYMLAATLLAALRNRNVEVTKFLHGRPQTNAYTLSEIHPVSGKKGEFYFCMGTTIEPLAKFLKEAFPIKSNLHVGSTNLVVTGIRESKLTFDPPTPIEVATLSPVLVREPDDHTRCLIPQDKNYLSALNVLIKKKIERWVGDEGSCEVLRVIPQAIRKRRIANGNVLATKGHFFLHGTPKGLRFILEQGLGANTAMGFGFVVPTGGW